MFKINGIWWKLYFVSPSDPMLFRSDGSLTLGACDNEINTIFIILFHISSSVLKSKSKSGGHFPLLSAQKCPPA